MSATPITGNATTSKRIGPMPELCLDIHLENVAGPFSYQIWPKLATLAKVGRMFIKFEKLHYNLTKLGVIFFYIFNFDNSFKYFMIAF